MSAVKKITLALILIVVLVGCVPAQEIQIVQAKERNIRVTGEGMVMVTPDVAVMTIVLQTNRKLLVDAKKYNHDIAAKVLEVFEKYDIAKEDIKMDYQWISSTLDKSGNPLSYDVKNSIEVTIRHLDIFDDLLYDVIDAGANVTDVYFQVSSIEEYADQARSLAIQDAKRKAVVLANGFGQDVGDPLSISVHSGYDYYNGNYFWRLSPAYTNCYSNQACSDFRQVPLKIFLDVEFQLK